VDAEHAAFDGGVLADVLLGVAPLDRLRALVGRGGDARRDERRSEHDGECQSSHCA
jgi:hypothetical protein